MALADICALRVPLYCFITYCISCYHIALYRFTLYHFILFYTISFHVVMYCVEFMKDFSILINWKTHQTDVIRLKTKLFFSLMPLLLKGFNPRTTCSYCYPNCTLVPSDEKTWKITDYHSRLMWTTLPRRQGKHWFCSVQSMLIFW